MLLKNKCRWLAVAMFVGLVGIAALLLFSGKFLPSSSVSDTDDKKIIASDEGWNVPVRYAFISDKDNPKMAVFDTYTQTIVAHITLQASPDSIDISPQGGFMLYAKRGEKTLYRLDLRTLEQQPITVTAPVEQLTVHASGRWVAYTSDNKVILSDLSSNQELSINTRGKVSLLYAPAGDTLFINETDQGKLTRINLLDQQQQVLFDLGKPISPISIMPNMMALFFSVDKQLYRYSLLDEKLTHYPSIAADERPYITSESRNLLTISNSDSHLQHNSQRQPRLLLVNAYTLALKHSYQLSNIGKGDDKIATGWLEQTAVVIGKQHITSFNLSSHQQKTTPLSGKLIDRLVQADSKVLLATIEKSSQLVVFNMKTQRIDARIDTGLKQPDKVLMGQTATLCH